MPIWAIFACATVALVLYKVSVWRSAPAEVRPSIIPVCTGGMAVAAASILVPPSVGAAVNNALGIPSFAALLMHVLTLMWAGSAHAMLVYWRHDRARAWRTTRWAMAFYATVVAAETILFFLGAPEENHDDFTVTYASAPWLSAMLAIHYLAYSVTMGGVVLQCWRWSLDDGTLDRPWLRRGLRTTSFGLAFSCTGSILILVALIGRWSGASWSTPAILVGQECSTVALPLVIVGMTISAWGPRISLALQGIQRAYDDTRDYRRLKPLWTTLNSAGLPRIHRSRGLADWAPGSRLLWRIVEINDWHHRLRPHAIDREHADHEAAMILDAIDAYERGEVPRIPEAADDARVSGRTAHVIVDERSWLLLVSQALHDRTRTSSRRPEKFLHTNASTDVHGGLTS
ncbi:MAB_1171c family putative transporter [Allokutzneria sp. NRRL B-24872]|uniref:MAB_1171c family putative transporter n=1 Tax=Allokutzneria sp. NRRL B-24872 TaxID=1137961 RepID=UPI000A373F92|nr:MAB_1171c family putative transporter [Allokutzneria sp. NRRL B-24872]